MEISEKKDLEEFIKRNTSDRHRVYLKYLELFKDAIKNKGSHYSSINKNEMLTNATIAVNDMFDEAYRALIDGYNRVEREISLPMLFNKHLTRQTRLNKKENDSVYYSIKEDFKKTISKTSKKHVYDGYMSSVAVQELYNNQPLDHPDLVNNDYPGSPENEQREYILEIMELISDKDSNAYKDMCEKYMDGKSNQAIADDPRNKGISKSTIANRVAKYLNKIKFKLIQEKYRERRI